MKKQTRPLRVESLEQRQVLSANPIVSNLVLASHTAGADLSVVAGSEDPDAVELTNFQETVLDAVEEQNDWTKVLSADFTGDGVTDFLGHAGGKWWLQVNDGTQLFPVELGDRISDGEVFDAVDITGDGRLDVVTVNRTTGEIWVLAMAGSTATETLWGQMDDITASSEIFVGDFSADGQVDVIVGNVGDTWVLAENTGDAFSNAMHGDFPDFAWEDVLQGDFNGDNASDIAVRGTDQTWWVWFGRDGGFEPAEYRGHWKMNDTWHDVQVGDFTNDGRDDIVGRTEDGRLWIGTATDTRFHTWYWSTGWVHRARWSNVTLVDVDNDGLLDQVGKDKKDRWWFAHNVGNRFENHFWLRNDQTDDHEVLTDVRRSEAVDVVMALPAGGTIVPTPGDLDVSLNDDNKLVLTGNGNLTGLQLQSPSGSLIPGNVEPFTASLANTPMQIVLIPSLGGFYELDGSATLDVGWQEDAAIADLTVNYGITGNGGTQLDAAVTPELGTLNRMPQAGINRDYYDSLPS